MNQNTKHVTVLLKETIEVINRHFNNKNNLSILDATFGTGNGCYQISKLFNNSKIIGIDLDSSMQTFADEIKKQINLDNQNNNFEFFCLNHKNIQELKTKFDLIYIDLGISTYQIKHLNKGFSFNDSNLDMRINNESNNVNAFHIINNASQKELIKIFKICNDKNIYKIVNAIIKHRKHQKIQSSLELTNIINKTLTPFKHISKNVNLATKTFMSLRIFINEEIENFLKFLNNLNKTTNNNGKVIILTFHSLEIRALRTWLSNNKSWKIIETVFPSSKIPQERSSRLFCINKII